MTDPNMESRLLTKKRESSTNVDEAAEELEETSRDVVVPKRVGFLKRLLISALLASGDNLAANTIIGTQQNMRSHLHQHIPQKLQNVADKIFIDPALDAYGAAALDGYEKAKHVLALYAGDEYDRVIKPSKHSIHEINQKAKLPPPMVHKRGGIKRAAFIKGVKIIRSTIDNAMDRREKRRQEQIEKFCNGTPGCVRQFTQTKLEEFDRKVIETMRMDLKVSAEFLLNGLACNQGIKCDNIHHLLGLDKTGNNPAGMLREVAIGNAPVVNKLKKN